MSRNQVACCGESSCGRIVQLSASGKVVQEFSADDQDFPISKQSSRVSKTRLRHVASSCKTAGGLSEGRYWDGECHQDDGSVGNPADSRVGFHVPPPTGAASRRPSWLGNLAFADRQS